MAKSNKKTSKSKKSNKSKQSKSVKQRQAKQQKTEQIHVANSAPILGGVIVSFVAAFLIGLLLITTAEDRSIQSSAKPSPNSGQQTIEVTEPNSGTTPEATGVNLQGSSPEGQQAEGGLQTPQTGDQLQPNAKIKDYENAILN